jgi:hypothetical protein
MTPKNIRKLLLGAPIALALVFGAGCSDDSSSPTGPDTQPADTTPPSVPVDLLVDGNPTDGISVAWAPNSEPDLQGYAIQRSLDHGVTWQNATSGPVSSNSFSDTYHTRADYRVAAVDLSDNQSAFSNSKAYIFVGDTGGGKYPENPIQP